MKKTMNLICLLAFVLFSCSKETEIPRPGNKPVPGNPDVPVPPTQPAADSVSIFIKAVIKVGLATYDSIPADLVIASTLENGQVSTTNKRLLPGSNNLKLPKSAVSHRIRLSQWNITDEQSISSQELKEGMLVEMGGTKGLKKLKMEMEYLEVQGNFQPKAKRLYTYNTSGNLAQVDYFRKLPEYSDLRLTLTDKGVYTNGTLSGVDRYNEKDIRVAQTGFEYSASGQIVNVSQDSYGQKTYNTIEYGVVPGGKTADIYLLFDNGQNMHYNMKFVGGNKVEDRAASSTGASEGGKYNYDSYINPYHQVLFPDLYLANSSKNNLITQQKGYGGVIPVAVLDKQEYTYDADGYPVVLIKYFKSGQTNQALYRSKIVFTY
ncbi:hypothetical protein [Flavihumibacter solisilvae]|uniref:DUF4595 domain-containing protein n=1 Tax=Flavihumibacter solisilvae TaxID=1349421 RepID=A0A0C1KZX4_9BACT|nr:hypothetical protein [Flavihumibacter solisilvae]KIC93282.1 hypothetical protein OI18_18710 [Flavihumibacter solisilvae]